MAALHRSTSRIARAQAVPPALLQGRVGGVDEAGRGPLAGPVYAACVVLDPARPIVGLDDSKRLSAARREALAEEIRRCALAHAVASATAQEIDGSDILAASLLAMQRAVQAIAPLPDRVLVDGLHCPDLALEAVAVVGGDARVAAISAASILAKTARDRHMEALAVQFPGYGFERHKGYPTAEHLEALARLGACAAHRRSFAPVRARVQVQAEKGAGQ